MRKINLFTLIVTMMFATMVTVNAKEYTVCSDGCDYKTILEAKGKEELEDNILKLKEDTTLDETIALWPDMTLDLGGYTLKLADGVVLGVLENSITITNGTIDLGSPTNNGANESLIVMQGSTTKDGAKTELTITDSVIINAKYNAILIQPDVDASYNTILNFNGKINSVKNGISIYGDIQVIDSAEPIVNIGPKAVIKSEKTTAVYGAGYSTMTIEGSLTGVNSAIGIKAGKYNFKNAKLLATGPKKAGSYHGSGINETGAAIQIESNNGYAGNIEIVIDGGEYTSSYGNVIYHYLAPKTEDEVVESKLSKPVQIKGGTFKGTLEMMKSDEIEISGGTFTDSTVNAYIKEGLKVVKDGSMYTVVDANKGELVITAPEVKASEEVDEKVAKELTEAKLTDTVTGLKEAIDSKKIDGVEDTLVEVKISSEIKSYDKEKGVLVLDIKPYYTVSGETKVLPNDAINGKVKIKVAVPNEITFTHAKVIHKNGETVIDTKEYEIKEESGQKYIEIETESFSTFEVSFYTPEKVENPNTVDGILVYTSVTLISLSLLGAAALVLKKKMN